MENNDLLLTDEELGKAVWGGWNAEHLRVAKAQLSKVINAGYKSPKEVDERLTELRRYFEQKITDVRTQIIQSYEAKIEEVDKLTPLTDGELHYLWAEYETQYPSQEVSWEDVLVKAQLNHNISQLKEMLK